MRIGAISVTMQVIFAALVVILVLTVIWSSLVVPSVISYGNEHATLIAQSLATSINSLSNEEEGYVTRDLGLLWNVKVFHKGSDAYMHVSGQGYESGNIILIGDADDFSATNIDSITVLKEPGKVIRLISDTGTQDSSPGDESGSEGTG